MNKSHRIYNAIGGFILGVLTAPLAIAAWPAIVAWFFYSETDDLDHVPPPDETERNPKE